MAQVFGPRDADSWFERCAADACVTRLLEGGVVTQVVVVVQVDDIFLMGRTSRCHQIDRDLNEEHVPITILQSCACMPVAVFLVLLVWERSRFHLFHFRRWQKTWWLSLVSLATKDTPWQLVCSLTIFTPPKKTMTNRSDPWLAKHPAPTNTEL